MKVSELISKLTEFPPEMVVSVDGYEAGITDDIGVREIKAYIGIDDAHYYGEHEEVGGSMDFRAQDAGVTEIQPRLLLERYPRA